MLPSTTQFTNTGRRERGLPGRETEREETVHGGSGGGEGSPAAAGGGGEGRRGVFWLVVRFGLGGKMEARRDEIGRAHV